MLLKKELGVIENSFYEASIQRPATSPPLAERTSTDVCVVGGGYTGISSAIELAERGYSVVLLEAQRIGWGASGRNGGQVIVGFGAEGEEAIAKQLSADDARRAWDISVEGMQLLKDRITNYKIDCDYTPGYLNLAVKAGKVPDLRKWYDTVTQTYGYPLQWIEPDEIGKWIASPRFHSGVYDDKSGHIHPLKYCLVLAEVARSKGVRIFENSAVYAVERGERPVVKTAQGELNCRFLVLAGNVYIGEYGEIASDICGKIMPVGTYIIATEPMDQGRADALIPSRAAVTDTNFVLDYFRLSADNRLLFGAGESYSGTTPRNLIANMRSKMLTVFPQLADLSIEHSWGGFVDLTMNKAPHFGRLGNNIYYLQGFSGHGIASTGIAGKLVAEVIAGQAERFDLFARLKHHTFPGGTLLRTPLLVLGMMYYQLRDLL
ncbi:MAG: FAD-binding oxidoreductase [Gammaproteobacteria bacterium]|nr:MAG: FAD-binding oxidoreductase [Gammaproteobacteria bacterium]